MHFRQTLCPRLIYLFAILHLASIPGIAFGINSVSSISKSSRKSQLQMAAIFPQTLKIQVVGDPALASVIQGAVVRALETKLTTQVGANVTFNLGSISSLIPGRTENVVATVTASSPTCAQAFGQATVEVTNIPNTFPNESQLWFDNQPENLQIPTHLYANRLQAGQSVRILYHHVCFNTMPMFLTAYLINDSDLPARIVLISGDAMPDKNPALAGLLAAEEYLPERINSAGDLITIPPHSEIPIALRSMVMGQVMSGLCSVELLSGGAPSILFRTDCGYFVSSDNRTQVALESTRPWLYLPPKRFRDSKKATLSSNSLAFTDPQQSDSAEITIGHAIYSQKIGVEGIARIGGGRNLNGNYGVLYTNHLVIKNPTETPTEFSLLFHALAGYSGGMFMVDGRAVPIRPVKLGTFRTLAKFVVPARGERILDWDAIPCSGSGYPDEVVASIHPILSARPMPPVPPLAPIHDAKSHAQANRNHQ